MDHHDPASAATARSPRAPPSSPPGSAGSTCASSATAPPTVLWSSMFVDSHTWDPVLPLLPSGRRYVLVDPPGLGLSEPLRAASDIAGAADAATDLLAGLGVDGPVDWVGNAFGGHVGFKLAARPGVLRSLVAVSSPTQPLAAPLRRQITLLLPDPADRGPVGPVRSAILTAMLTDASRRPTRLRRIVVESLARPTRRSMALAVRSFILNRVDVTAELADLTVPSLFVASDDRGDWSPAGRRRLPPPSHPTPSGDGPGRPHAGPPRAAGGPGLPRPPVLGPAGLSAHAVRRTRAAPRADVPSSPCGAPSPSPADRSSRPPACSPAPASTRTRRGWTHRRVRPPRGRPWASSAPPSTRPGWSGRCPGWRWRPAATATWSSTSRAGGRPRSPGRRCGPTCTRSGYDARGWGFGTNTGRPAPRRRATVRPRARPGRRGRARPRRWSAGAWAASSPARWPAATRTPYAGSSPTARRWWAGRATPRSPAPERGRRPVPTGSPETATPRHRSGCRSPPCSPGATGSSSWQACIDRSTPGVEHVEVSSTHLGMGVDPDVWAVVADRLSRDPD